MTTFGLCFTVAEIAIPPYGFEGAAYATLLAFAVASISLVYLTRTHILRSGSFNI